MPTSPRDIYELAGWLGEQKEGEAALRSTVSRAYYAALLQTQLTFPQPQRAGNESSHSVIIDSAVLYGRGANPGRDEARVIGMWLARMRRLRNLADYDLGEAVTAADAAGALQRAQDILDRCERILQRRAAVGASEPSGDVTT